MEELDSLHQEQMSTMQTELKKEMNSLQKKILMESVSKDWFRHGLQSPGVLAPLSIQHNQEISNVRRSLKTMLAQV